ncbi:hypothetical protein [Vineibacter terrae]|uniref:hypothetical protein n=1 Tax=Vineibacter terrae TaxID=2586908 RepID=UPI0015B3D443|nr:hypothetical protein [Vineibacter terrae]
MRLEGKIPDSPTRLRELPLLTFDGRPFLTFAVVDAATATLDIVWQPEEDKPCCHPERSEGSLGLQDRTGSTLDIRAPMRSVRAKRWPKRSFAALRFYVATRGQE